MISFARGGVCTAFDIAPTGLNGGGAWSARGRDLALVVWYGVDGTDEAPPVTLRVAAEAVVDGDELAGTFAFEVFFNGQQVDRVEGGTWEATRITA